MPNFDEHCFATITDESITILGHEGWNFISISVTDASTAAANISSDYAGKIGGKDNGSISLDAGEGTTIGSGRESINGVTIDAPSGCTVKITGVKNKTNNGA